MPAKRLITRARSRANFGMRIAKRNFVPRRAQGLRGMAMWSTSESFTPAWSRQYWIARTGRPAAYFTRFRRSSSTAARSRPSARIAAEALAWYALMPRMTIRNIVAEIRRAVSGINCKSMRRFRGPGIRGDGTAGGSLNDDVRAHREKQNRLDIEGFDSQPESFPFVSPQNENVRFVQSRNVRFHGGPRA